MRRRAEGLRAQGGIWFGAEGLRGRRTERLRGQAAEELAATVESQGAEHSAAQPLSSSAPQRFSSSAIGAQRVLLIALAVLSFSAEAGAQCGGSKPTVNPVSATLGIFGTATTPEMVLNGIPVGGPDFITVEPNGLQREKVTMVVGSEIVMNITASWAGSYEGHNLTLYAYEDPGVPNRAQLDAQECLGQNDICNPVKRVFRWQPIKGQEGRTHSMCFMVIPLEENACVSDYHCVDIEVKASNLTWDREDGLTPQPNQEYHEPVGCHLDLCFQARDQDMLYEVDVSPVEGTLPPAAQFDVMCEAMTPSTELHPLYPPREPQAQVFTTLPCKRCMHWDVPIGLETLSYRPCFRATDKYSLRTIETCVEIEVPKCKYCVQQGDTLHFINKKYHLNSNWLQLWNANGMEEIVFDPLAKATPFGDPDQISNGNSIINLGPSYKVKDGESLVNLAARFRTTMKKILDINPDVKDEDDLSAGTKLCVMPCTDPPSIARIADAV